ncbi:MAG: NAD(P)-dependent glycerol-3-phosphate dehydrogenase [Betaproteobacteria bacterium]|nr:NAD(P)-dependent glycerol-3-phosphate dehydrogenase [Betaproteobacteria bacterium]
MKIGVIGAGAWGLALAVTLSRRHQITLWARSDEQRDLLSATRRHGYLPGIELPANVSLGSTRGQTIAASDVVLVATPTAALREVLADIANGPAGRPVIGACKGFEQGTAHLPHQIATSVLGDKTPYAALSGPSFALEVARGLPAALTLASTDEAFAATMSRELHHSRFRIYFTPDITGVEVGGAVKNVMAIATGISDGLDLGLNARAALITRGLAELTRLGVAMGGRLETFIGLAGAGDLVLTCTGALSRNRRVGLELAAGKPIAAVLEQLGHVAEGVHTARAVAHAAQSLGVDMPITRAVCAVLFENMSPRDAVEQLLSRDPRPE